MTTEIIHKIAIWYIPIYVILLLIPTAVLFFKEFKFLIYFIFDKLCLDWNKKIEKPRIFFAGVGYIFVWCAWSISKLRFGNIWFCTPLSVLLSIFGLFIIYFVLSKTFENKFLKYIKEKLNVSVSSAIISPETHDIENIFNSLSSSSLKSNITTFCDFINLTKISEKDKIEWTDAIVKLVRFVFILFDIKTVTNSSLKHDTICPIIEHYFQKNGDNIKLTETGTEISNVKKEMELEKEIFFDYKKEILALIEQNTK